MLDLASPLLIAPSRLQLTVESTIRQRHLGGCSSRDAASGRDGSGWEGGKVAAESAVLGPRFRQKPRRQSGDFDSRMCSARAGDNNALQWSRGFGRTRVQAAVDVSRREGGDGSFESLKAGLIFGRSQPGQLLEGPKQQPKVLTGNPWPACPPALVGLHTAVWCPSQKKSLGSVALWGLVKGNCGCTFLAIPFNRRLFSRRTNSDARLVVTASHP